MGLFSSKSEKPSLNWEHIYLDGFRHNISRTKVPGGWLVIYWDRGVTFLPDPDHSWDGKSLP